MIRLTYKSILIIIFLGFFLKTLYTSTSVELHIPQTSFCIQGHNTVPDNYASATVDICNRLRCSFVHSHTFQMKNYCPCREYICSVFLIVSQLTAMF